MMNILAKRIFCAELVCSKLFNIILPFAKAYFCFQFVIVFDKVSEEANENAIVQQCGRTQRRTPLNIEQTLFMMGSQMFETIIGISSSTVWRDNFDFSFIC